MLQFEKRLDHSQNHKLCTQGPFLLQLVLLRFFAHRSLQSRKGSLYHYQQSPSHKPSLAKVFDTCWRFGGKKRVYYPLSFDVFNISTFKSCLKYLNPTNFPPVSCSSQTRVSGSVSKLPGIWCKEIRELVRKQFNQSITTLWWTAVWQMTENPLAPGTSTCDSAPPIFKQRQLYQLRVSVSWKNHLSNFKTCFSG